MVKPVTNPPVRLLPLDQPVASVVVKQTVIEDAAGDISAEAAALNVITLGADNAAGVPPENQSRKRFELANEVREKYELEKPEDKSARLKKVDGAKGLAIELRQETERLDSLSKKYSGEKPKTLDRLAATKTGTEADELRELAKIRREKINLMSPSKKREYYNKFYISLVLFRK